MFIERLADNIALFIISMIIMPTYLYYTTPDLTTFIFISSTIVLVLDTINAAITLD